MHCRAQDIHGGCRHYGEETHRDDYVLLNDRTRIVDGAVGFACLEVMLHTTLVSFDDAAPQCL